VNPFLFVTIILQKFSRFRVPRSKGKSENTRLLRPIAG
jgi:hypothetical protein